MPSQACISFQLNSRGFEGNIWQMAFRKRWWRETLDGARHVYRKCEKQNFNSSENSMENAESWMASGETAKHV